jgi:hypothetical protein
VLRAYPLACAILAMALRWRVAAHLLPEAGAPLVLAPFSLAPVLIFYAAEAKQYSSDIAISLALLLVALELSDSARTVRLSRMRIVTAAAIGVASVWLSQPAVIMLAGLGAALAIGAFGSRGWRPLSPLVWILAAWMLSALAATLVSIRHLTPHAHRFMLTFWSEGFWPLSLRHPSSLAWPITHTALLIGSQLGIPTSIGLACALLAVGGIVATWKNEWRTSLLLVVPLLVALGASAAQLYPFAGRLAVFLVPSLLLLAAIGITEIAALARVKHGSAGVLAVVTLFLLALGAQSLYASPPVYRREEIAPAIAYLRRESRASDEVYVYYGAVPAYEFYDARDSLAVRATMGGCHRGDSRAYRTELDALRGSARVWLLFAHELPRFGEREMMLAHLDGIGRARDSMIVNGRDTDGKITYVRLYLYDLATPPARDSIAARDITSPDSAMRDAGLQCAPPGE